MIVIVDYGMGNSGSIRNMLKYVGVSSIISSSVEEISAADKLILPGVGSFDAGMRNLREMGLEEPLRRKALQEKVPVLGICLGMQLLTHASEEGTEAGLGWIDAETIRFIGTTDQYRIRVPHMGWNAAVPSKVSPLLSDVEQDSRYYFVHSYHVVCRNQDDVLCRTPYGDKFVSAVQRENIYGTQFHPEKSHRYGMRLLENFAKRC